MQLQLKLAVKSLPSLPAKQLHTTLMTVLCFKQFKVKYFSYLKAIAVRRHEMMRSYPEEHFALERLEPLTQFLIEINPNFRGKHHKIREEESCVYFLRASFVFSTLMTLKTEEKLVKNSKGKVIVFFFLSVCL